MLPCQDNYATTFNDYPSMLGYHKALSMESNWCTCKVKDLHVLLKLMRSPSAGRSIEYMDNRISLYAAQYGCCAITGKPLATSEIHCHHKQPIAMGGSDRYENLVIVHWKIHLLIHATQESTIQQLLSEFELSDKQLAKLNKLREYAGLQTI